MIDFLFESNVSFLVELVKENRWISNWSSDYWLIKWNIWCCSIVFIMHRTHLTKLTLYYYWNYLNIFIYATSFNKKKVFLYSYNQIHDNMRSTSVSDFVWKYQIYFAEKNDWLKQKPKKNSDNLFWLLNIFIQEILYVSWHKSSYAFV